MQQKVAEGADRFAGRETPMLGQAEVDLLIEVGPGQVLSNLVHDAGGVPAVSLDAGGNSLKGLLQALGAAFALGASVKHAALFADRFTRPFDLDWKPKFFTNPCELAPLPRSGVRETSPTVSAGTRGALPSHLSGLVAVEGQQGATVSEARGAAAEALQAGIRAESATAASATPGIAPLELVRQLVAGRAELPAAAVQDGSRMLSDLHLNSITVGQLVSEAAKQLGLPRVAGLTEFADASVAEVARALEELRRTGGTAHADDKRRQPPGVDLWIRCFSVELVEAKRPAGPRATPPDAPKHAPPGWQVFGPKDHPLIAALRAKLAKLALGGVLLCLPESPTEAVIPLLLEAARAVLAIKTDARFVLVQHGWGGSGFARTLHLEIPGLTTCVINVPPGHPQAVDWIMAEIASARGYVEAHCDAAGHRREPRLKLAALGDELPGGSEAGFPIGAEDVLLVTGGGKGIAAECALALGRDTGARLALLGRSDPATDKELAGNLSRCSAVGVKCCYVRADVTDARAVRLAVAEVQKQLGPITALLHGAGTNTPQLLNSLDEQAFRRTVAPKLDGARNVLAAVDPERLKLFVTFGSIIARSGLRGEADYATANEWMTAFTETFQARHPQCRCVAFEWSVWSGVGMGERLGSLEALIRQGITPIPPDEGIRLLREILRRPGGPVALVVTGRFGEPPALRLPEAELPLQRFLERKRAHYPGVELVVDAELSLESDPYLKDHVVQKERLFPAVLGLEAMAQTAMALMETTALPTFEKVELTRPVAVPDKGNTILRLAALRRGHDLVEVCLRCDATDFYVDHFRAFCRFNGSLVSGASRLEVSSSGATCLPLEPQRELYGGILFHEGRFRRVAGYRSLQAKECVAELTSEDGAAWFGSYLPTELVLGDPGARDAALHAIQACIPHARILPVGIERIVVRRAHDTGPRLARAKERLRNGPDFVFDLEVTTPAGEVIERWDGLQLRAVGAVAPPSAWPVPLVGPYLERRLEELLPDSPVKVVLVAGGRALRSDAAIRRLIGDTGRLWRRADGKPMTLEGGSVSASHAGALTLAVAGQGSVGCDLEELSPRTAAEWGDLLGAEFRLAERIAREQAEPLDTAATRLWNTREALKKSGAGLETPLVLEAATPDGWVMLRAGTHQVATCALIVGGAEKPLVVAVATEGVAVAVSSGRQAASMPAVA